jgi:hypothetical protein
MPGGFSPLILIAEWTRQYFSSTGSVVLAIAILVGVVLIAYRLNRPSS